VCEAGHSRRRLGLLVYLRVKLGRVWVWMGVKDMERRLLEIGEVEGHKWVRMK
jgi:hypothetical protein